MPAKIIDGKAIAETIRGELKAEIESVESAVVPPCLAVIIVGERKDSQTYVNLKHKAASEIGMKSIQVELPATVSQEELESKISELNQNPDVHGFILQLPLPKHLDEGCALEKISPMKDVDGLHATNVGLLHCRHREPWYKPCTPLGCLELLRRSGVEIAGKRAVVIGRSNVVGNPMSQLLLQANATPTICHSKTTNLEAITREADITDACCGQPEVVKGIWIKPCAAIIDVGTNPVDDSSKKSGFRLVGDVAFEEAVEIAGCITPVPGGVGPMTIAMLLRNTVQSWKRVIQEKAM